MGEPSSNAFINLEIMEYRKKSISCLPFVWADHYYWKEKKHSQTLPMLYAQNPQFVYLVSGKDDKARKILVQALEHDQLSKLMDIWLWFCSLKHGFQPLSTGTTMDPWIYIIVGCIQFHIAIMEANTNPPIRDLNIW